MGRQVTPPPVRARDLRGCGQGDGVIDEKRALQMYELALPLVQAKGHFVTMGVMTFKEYSTGRLSIIYMPSTGHLDVWHGRKVLAVN